MRSNTVYNTAPGQEKVSINGMVYKKGDKVKLNLAKQKSGAIDMFNDGRIVTIEKIYADYDDTIFLAVTFDEDPRQQMYRELNMYQYYLTDEVEPIP